MDTGMPLAVAVNISAINLQDQDFPTEVENLLREYQVPASMLELEVTETAIMTDPLRAMENITRLSDLGVQVSIDDFGTGYSSMAYLKKLLVAKIKIDKSFVMDMHRDSNDAVIVRSTIDLGHNLGLKVVAEGVEDQEAWDRLKALGCDAAQGYHMSKPLPAEKFLQWYDSLATADAGAQYSRVTQRSV
jgi:EAL domain-containing protein (putative c-di-GMP-specific phosphodiesterase class I)